MTLIIAARYNKGILIAYDTAQTKINNGNLEISRYIEKFRPIPNSNICMGFTGLFDKDPFEQLSNKIKKSQSSDKDIEDFLLSQSHWSADYLSDSANRRQYIFTIRTSSRVRLLTTDNSKESNPRDVQIVGLGSGFYEPIKDFLENNYSPGMKLRKLEAVLNNAFSIADDCNTKDLHSKPNLIIKGFGLAMVNRNGYRPLEFYDGCE